MFGKYPIILFALRQALTEKENTELKALMVKSPKTEDDVRRYELLNEKASLRQSLSMMIPIIIDGDVVPMQVTDSSLNMNKQVSIQGNGYEITPTQNVSTVNIVSAASGFTSSVVDMVFMLADTAFQRQVDKAPSIAFFGDRIAIPYGYLTGVALSTVADTNQQVISLTIARDLLAQPLGMASETAEVVEKTGVPFEV